MAKRSCTSTSSSSSSTSSSSSSACSRRLVPRHYVKHDYHDYANEPNDPAKTPIRRRKGGVTTPFPIVLHRVIAAVQDDGLSHIFGWQPHGRAFLIHKPKEFVEVILPTYFKQNKLTSFQRQLNLYGFNRLTRGPDASGYYHEYFLRDREYLAKRMIRQRIKGTKIKGAASPEAEPDFYSMPTVGPTIDETANSVAPSSTLVVSSSSSSSSSLRDTPVVSCDDMSHDYSDYEEEEEVESPPAATAVYTSITTGTDQPEIIMDTTTTTTSNEIPSMTDYTPMYSSVTMQNTGTAVVVSPGNEKPIVVPTTTTSSASWEDPADALLMDLHQQDPLEDFGWILPTTTTSTANQQRNHQGKSHDNQEDEDAVTLHVLEQDAALGVMLTHALEYNFDHV